MQETSYSLNLGTSDSAPVKFPSPSELNAKLHRGNSHLSEHSSCQMLVVVTRWYRDDSLCYDGARVIIFVHEVDSGTCESDTRGDDSFVHSLSIKALASKSGQEAWVYIQHSSRESSYHFFGDQLHHNLASVLFGLTGCKGMRNCHPASHVPKRL